MSCPTCNTFCFICKRATCHCGEHDELDNGFVESVDSPAKEVLVNIAIGAACFIGNKPRSIKPKQYAIGARCKWVSPISPRGKRKPIRAIGWHQMWMQFWGKGLVAYADSLERAQARDLTLHERNINTMSWEEIEATQHLEPLSESRRSYLTRGEGILTLDKAEYDEGSIGEIVADDLNGIDVSGESSEPDWNAAALHNNFGSRVAYDVLDPITAKQIAWEQEMWHSGEITVVAPAQRASTGPKMPEKQALALGRKFEAFVRNEVDRMMSLDDAIMHGSYEFETFDDDGNRVIMTHLHSPRGLALDEQRYGAWHGTVQDRAEVGIGSIDADEDTEALMGSRGCPECPDGILAAHSNITSGPYEGAVFCSNEDCDYSTFDRYYHHNFDTLVRRLEAGVAA